ncbi:MAG: methylmalonyl-CoA mutase family protein [Chloroflexi bacterium]|nr:methylmalonyl-CoA mutase family protein [Chloroflexota bacterium]
MYQALEQRSRFVIATPVCDGHDVAAAAITRILRREGAEAVYIGFNKTAYQIVKAAVEEDASAIAISTYNGGHVSFLKEVLVEQRAQGIPEVPLFAGGGGTILESEVGPLERLGVAKVYRPPLDLTEAVRDMIERAAKRPPCATDAASSPEAARLSRQLTAAENTAIDPKPAASTPRVWGLGGRGGAGKSTLIDELLLRFLRSTTGRIAVIAADPTLGDRLRMLHCYSPRVFLRSVKVGPGESTETKVGPYIQALREWPFDLILVESVGLGQNEVGVAPLVDASIFCMTPEYGTDVQLEKEALLGLADVVVMNKRDFPQAEARGRRVRNFVRNGQTFIMTEAKQFGDAGVTELFNLIASRSELQTVASGLPTNSYGRPVPVSRRGYLGAIVDAHEAYYQEMEREAAGDDADSYNVTYAQLWDTYGFDGSLEPGSIEDGVLYRTDGGGPKVPVARQTTTGIWVPVLGLPPRDAEQKQVVRYLYKQNVPGAFPYTEGAYRHRRTDEDPIRMFAGLGAPETTNERFHMLADGHGAPRLSTAFDSLTLYGRDSDEPGAIAKVGEGGVAVDTVEDMERLYAGFDLHQTSVSLTMNGPAPTILAMYLVAAKRRGFDFRKLRGTIQTDILKEVQAQNEALFPIEPSLRLIGDMIDYTMREAPSWYPISISGYHIGEAGANAIQELAFTLANGFTYVEALKARGASIDEFARRFSFFFTSGSELEFNVLGRVARRVWAVGMRRYYGVEGPAAALKFHSQTSGRSLQDMEPLHNLTRVALQAEHALHNNTNSLHTNSYKETYTTPQQDDVLLAIGSQQIPLTESGDFRFTENLNQGAFGLSYLEDEVERAVHRVFREIDEQGGVLAGVENEYFRTSIQEEVQREREAIRAGQRRVVGVNYLRSPDADPARGKIVHIPMREKRSQVARTKRFKREHAKDAKLALARLQAAALSDTANVFEELLHTVEVATIGQVTDALWEVWGRFRPSM